jgi:glycosyltransferase involved in cell wall biosynthesis
LIPGQIYLSIIIPVYNEQESLVELRREIDSMLKQEGWQGQLIFVDDGSTDLSWSVIQSLANNDDRVQGVRFRRNFGKAAALRAGFELTRGNFVATLDADLQDDPAELPGMLKQLEADKIDVVSGWKQVRYDPWHKVLPSRVFNGAVSWVSNVKLHDHNCGMKMYRSAVVKEVRLYGEFHRFIPVLARAKGFQIGERVVKHRRRKFGHSKYGMKRFLKGLIDLFTVRFLTRYGQRPAHIFGSIGLFLMMLGAMLVSWDALDSLLNLMDRHLPRCEAQTLLGSLFALAGGQFFALGLATEAVVAKQWTEESPFVIMDRVGIETASTPS